MPSVRLLGPADAAAYRALRLDALQRHPCAFRASFDEEAGQSLDELAARLEADAIFGAYCDGALCGLAGLEIPQARNKRHKGTLFGVYVCPDRRRAGLGTALVSRVIEHARTRVDQLHAAVVVTAEPARALYRKLGFEPYGLEPRALKVGEEYRPGAIGAAFGRSGDAGLNAPPPGVSTPPGAVDRRGSDGALRAPHGSAC